MVCIYCGSDTSVINSRAQNRTNKVWRRRLCGVCSSIFSSLEEVVYEGSFVVRSDQSHIVPFERDELFLSIYDACKHHENATTEATALTGTVLSKLVSAQRSATKGIIEREDLITLVGTVLKRFDRVAYTHYSAFHHLSSR